MSSGVLAERSPNTSPKKQQPADSTDAKAQMQGEVKKVSGLQQEQKPQTYVSPSDNIMSPTTKKLEAIRGKRFASGKPQSLFAKTVSKQSLARSESGGSLNQNEANSA